MPVKMIFIDSITAINADAKNAIVISGSHGGFSSTGFALNNPERPLLVFFNDAGVGKDNAGIYCLSALEQIGVACACYGHMTACIGQALDGYEHGVITHINHSAEHLGLKIGMRVNTACHQLEH
jgi:uncharacterized protein YunC (DUF1805 family)